MLYRESRKTFSPTGTLLRVLYVFDSRLRRQRRVEQDLLALSPHLQRDIGYPW